MEYVNKTSLSSGISFFLFGGILENFNFEFFAQFCLQNAIKCARKLFYSNVAKLKKKAFTLQISLS